jgi:hypothetical protein
MSSLEQTSGFLLLALVLLDVFLDVLYARLGTGILAPRISRMIWRIFLGYRGPEAGDDWPFCHWR